jgi:hypothetical protein
MSRKPDNIGMVFSFRLFPMDGVRTSHVPRPLFITPIAQDRHAIRIESAGWNSGLVKELHIMRHICLPGGLRYRFLKP